MLRCRIGSWALLSSICIVVASWAADAALPEISANDNRVPAGRLESGTLTLNLELRLGRWHPEAPDGRALDVFSFAEEGHEPQMPGPLIRVSQGTELNVTLRNLLPTAVEVHGLHPHPGDAGSAVQLAPGESKQLRFAAGDPGTYMYWASAPGQPLNRRIGKEKLLSGAFIVDVAGTKPADRIFVMQLWNKDVYQRSFEGVLTINGKSWPYTERLQARLNEPQHWRVLNATSFEHPMHLHGFYFYVNATSDGEAEQRYSEGQSRMVVTESVPPSHSFEMTWTPERTGNWIFHCHILEHMSSYKSPLLYGPDGPPAAIDDANHEYASAGMGMAGLVLGITVSDHKQALIPAKAVDQPVEARRHLFVRERAPLPYVPAGPGFYLEGVSQQVAAVGPPLLITRGQRTAITVTNELKEPTAIHWHGLEIESYYDGVAGWTGTAKHNTPAIEPGASFVAYMTPPRAGTFIYHTHWHNVRQLTGGMYGPLLVLEPGQKFDPATDKIFMLGRSGPNELRDPLVLNGSPQPGLMVFLAGQTYRFRFINITPNDSPVAMSLTLEGHPGKWRAIAKDGADLPRRQAVVGDSVGSISVGETYDFEFTPEKPGVYQLRFSSLLSEVSQMILVVPRSSPASIFAERK